MVGIRVARQSWMKIKTTRDDHSTRAIIRVSTISLMPAVIGLVASMEISYVMLWGKEPASSAMVLLMVSARATALDPGAW